MFFQLKIFNWFFSILLLISTSVFAQQSKVELEAERMTRMKALRSKDLPKKQKNFFERDLKLGWDVSNLLIGALSPSKTGIDISIDYTLKKNLYGIVELGLNNYRESSDLMDYYADGIYFRMGIDSRVGEKDKGRDIFYLGARYAFATFVQLLDNYQISSSYWPLLTGSELSFNNQAHWAEAILGFKVEVLKNIYLGSGLRFKFMLFQTGSETIKPAPFIPGYGKSSGTIIIGFNYNIYYNLPLNYNKKTPKRGQ